MILANYATLFLTVLHNGTVDVTLHQHTRRGRVESIGQRITIGRWEDVLRAINLASNVRVRVRVEE